MRYLCLCYYNIQAFQALNEDQQAALGKECQPHDEALRATGKLVVQGSLADPADWCYIAPGEGGPQEHNGPYLPGSDQVGAFFIVEAEDATEAKAVAAKHATANYGEQLGFAVEVRPCEGYQVY